MSRIVHSLHEKIKQFRTIKNSSLFEFKESYIQSQINFSLLLKYDFRKIWKRNIGRFIKQFWTTKEFSSHKFKESYAQNNENQIYPVIYVMIKRGEENNYNNEEIGRWGKIFSTSSMFYSVFFAILKKNSRKFKCHH